MGLPLWFWKFAYAGWLLVLLACAIILVLYLYRGFLVGLCRGACSPALASCVLLWSRESVLLARVCSVLLVSSLYRKLVLLFLIYIFLTFDQKKERALSLSILTMSGPGKFPRVESN